MRIPLSQIAVVERGRKDYGDLSPLAESIKLNGQTTAGVVRTAAPDDEGVDPTVTPWVLVAGGRRFQACALAGVPNFLCEDFGDLSPEDRQIIELEENLHRKDLTWDEEATMRKRIHQLYAQRAAADGRKWSLDDTSRVTGLSKANLSKDIAIAAAIEDDPGLKKAGSKKSATRIIEIRDHLHKKEIQQQSESGKSSIGRLQDLIVTEKAQDWLRNRRTGSTDLVLTDFPYGLDFYSQGQKTTGDETSASEYDDSEAVTLDLFVDVVPELIRITKDTGWIATFMCDSNYEFLKQLFESCCATHFDYADVWWEQQANGEWIWQRKNQCNSIDHRDCQFLHVEVPGWIWFRPNSRNPTRMPERHAKNFYERILVVNRGAGRLYKSQDECPNVLVYDAEYSNRLHAMQKPRAAARELVQRFTIPGESVVDPFYGSGNLLAGAAELGRKVSGCDANPLQRELAISNIGEFFNV
jgi:DNA modification methylase/ParB-like chromosome segregation protein Spo0J